MLIRFVVDNIMSFGEPKEINFIPNNRIRSLNHHKIEFENISILKMTSIYGANGAGKSNLIESLDAMQRLVTEENDLPRVSKQLFKFNSIEDSNIQVLAVEFMQDEVPFYYGLQLQNNLIKKEELYISGLGKKDDSILFERTTNDDKKTSIVFYEDFEKLETTSVFKDVLLDFIKPNIPILRLLAKRDNDKLLNIRKAYNWFKNSLQIIGPDSKPVGLVHNFDKSESFKGYATALMNSLKLGISSLTLDRKLLQDVVEDESTHDEIIQEFEKSENADEKVLLMRDSYGTDFAITKEGDDYWIKTILVEHEGRRNKKVLFELADESDGTNRLLDFVPAFKSLVSENCVFIIDEIERSIHPLLIKELVKKFSEDKDSKGQLIFTTHESNLLDLDIFRQDEIWFAEKDLTGSTDLYSLSDFKEHKTIDIRKGYLTGRYGSIPFLGNLKDLNWHK